MEQEVLKKPCLNRRAFITEYLKDFNGAQAAIRAGYSENGAAQAAAQILADPKVKAEMQEQLEAQETRTLITADKILANAYEISNADILDCFDENGALKPLDKIPVALRKCIASVEVDEIFEYDSDGHKKHVGYKKKIKFWSKDKQIELLMKHLKLINDKIDINVEVKYTLADKVKEARERVNNRLKASSVN